MFGVSEDKCLNECETNRHQSTGTSVLWNLVKF